MNNVSVFLLTTALIIASAWPIAKTVSANNPANRLAVSRSSAGAYRDGLFLGRLDVQAGRQVRVAVGRWNYDADRALFRAGYHDGYGQTITMIR